MAVQPLDITYTEPDHVGWWTPEPGAHFWLMNTSHLGPCLDVDNNMFVCFCNYGNALVGLFENEGEHCSSCLDNYITQCLY